MWSGLMGMTRRLQHYDVVSWQPWLWIAEAGAIIIFAGIGCQIVQLIVSIRHREELRDVTEIPGTPHAGMVNGVAAAGLELCRSAPRRRARAYWVTKKLEPAKQGQPSNAREYEPIEMPTNSPVGFVNAFLPWSPASP
jgi:cytochrome o ubiquinol oxidase subunit 1